MHSAELALLKKIRIMMGKKLNTLFLGEYHSAFRGSGLSFDSVREYQYGDDIKNIDWNVTARMNQLYVKEYIEERELSIVLAIDISGSTDFGSERRKSEVINEVAALFLYLAQMNNDRITVLLFSDRIERYIRPGRGRKYMLKVLDEIIRCEPESRKTDISCAVNFLNKVLKKRSVVFLISDFLDSDDSYQLRMKLLGRKHDVIPVQVYDPLERDMRIFGLTEFVDLESGKSFLSDALPEQGRYSLLQGFETIFISTGSSVAVPVLGFFEKRNRSRLKR